MIHDHLSKTMALPDVDELLLSCLFDRICCDKLLLLSLPPVLSPVSVCDDSGPSDTCRRNCRFDRVCALTDVGADLDLKIRKTYKQVSYSRDHIRC
jgi:hypothetical protein